MLLLAALLACARSSGEKGDDAAPYEGGAAGDCTDRADNDRDGYFDCEDNGCWGSPDCEGSDADADTE